MGIVAMYKLKRAEVPGVYDQTDESLNTNLELVAHTSNLSAPSHQVKRIKFGFNATGSKK